MSDHWTDGQFLLDSNGNPHSGKGAIYIYPGADSLELAQMAHAAEMRLRRLQIEHSVAGREGAPKAERNRVPALLREIDEAQRDHDRVERILDAKKERA